MRSLRISALIVWLICTGGAVLAADEGKMTPEEKAKVIKLLVDSQKETAEVAEHILMAEALLFSAMERALATQPNPEWETKTKGKTEFLEKVMVNRQGKAQAPESIVPTGKLSRAELIARLKE
jgi:hypothetical protein